MTWNLDAVDPVRKKYVPGLKCEIFTLNVLDIIPSRQILPV